MAKEKVNHPKNNIHDQFFKAAFSNPEVTISLSKHGILRDFIKLFENQM